MKNVIFFILFCLLSSLCLAETKKEPYHNDYLYSAEYFDYLIECAENERDKLINEQKEAQIEIAKDEPEEITEEFSPFQLKIEENVKTQLYKETFKKVDSKTIIPVAKKVAVIQDMSKTRNKYNSDDYKILAGAEFLPFEHFVLSSGLETNFRGLDQNPASRKVYLSPEFKFGKKVSLKFHNKLNVLNYTSDHDIGLNISPFKSQIVDFGVYSGLVRKKNGSVSESINFTTNFYF